MKDRKKKSAPPPEAATPFFARYLEGQTEEDAEARVTERGGRANVVFAKKATKKSTKKSAKKSGKKSSGAKAAATAVTRKFPSDNDEYVYFPYHPEAATAGPGSRLQTLKFPSDNDEGGGLYAVYADESDVPKTARAKPKKDAAVRLTTKAPKG